MLANLRLKYPESHLLEYIEKCKKGLIVIGHEMMQQLDILLEHFHDENITLCFPQAHKRIKFIETRCKHF